MLKIIKILYPLHLNEKEKRIEKGKGTTAPWCGQGRKFIIDMPESIAGTSGRVQSRHDLTELGHMGRGKGREGKGNWMQHPGRRPKVQKARNQNGWIIFERASQAPGLKSLGAPCSR